MSRLNARPIIFAQSNPTEQHSRSLSSSLCGRLRKAPSPANLSVGAAANCYHKRCRIKGRQSFDPASNAFMQPFLEYQERTEETMQFACWSRIDHHAPMPEKIDRRTTRPVTKQSRIFRIKAESLSHCGFSQRCEVEKFTSIAR